MSIFTAVLQRKLQFPLPRKGSAKGMGWGWDGMHCSNGLGVASKKRGVGRMEESVCKGLGSEVV